MALAEVVGQLTGLRRFPVRSLGGEAPEEVRVQGSGLAGDRIFDLFDEDRGSLLSAKTAPFLLRYRARYVDAMVRGTGRELWIRVRKPDGEEVPLSDRGWVEDVARRCGRHVQLRPRPGADSDPSPLHVLSVATVRFLGSQYGGPLESLRFRSNLILDLPESRPFEEDRWIGRQIWIGDVLAEVAGHCDRCIVTRLDTETVGRSAGLLSAIVRGRGGAIGVHARALTGSRLRLGDPVALVD